MIFVTPLFSAILPADSNHSNAENVRSIGWGLLSGTHSFERRIDLKESPIKTERKTLHLPEDTVRALNKLAAKNGTDFSKEVRRAIDEYLDLETTAENIDMINGVIRQELSGQLKALGNRLAGLINRLTIISAAGYYANIAIIADLIDQDRYFKCHHPACARWCGSPFRLLLGALDRSRGTGGAV